MSPLTFTDMQPQPPLCAVHPDRLAVGQLDATNYCAECYGERINTPPEESNAPDG